MGAAATDHFCSSVGSWSYRCIPGICCLLALFLLFSIFNPSVSNNPDQKVLKIMTWIYELITFGFCLYIKGVIFYEERVKHREKTGIIKF